MTYILQVTSNNFSSLPQFLIYAVSVQSGSNTYRVSLVLLSFLLLASPHTLRESNLDDKNYSLKGNPQSLLFKDPVRTAQQTPAISVI